MLHYPGHLPSPSLISSDDLRERERESSLPGLEETSGLRTNRVHGGRERGSGALALPLYAAVVSAGHGVLGHMFLAKDKLKHETNCALVWFPLSLKFCSLKRRQKV